jgi:hypothetical protein
MDDEFFGWYPKCSIELFFRHAPPWDWARASVLYILSGRGPNNVAFFELHVHQAFLVDLSTEFMEQHSDGHDVCTFRVRYHDATSPNQMRTTKDKICHDFFMRFRNLNSAYHFSFFVIVLLFMVIRLYEFPSDPAADCEYRCSSMARAVESTRRRRRSLHA